MNQKKVLIFSFVVVAVVGLAALVLYQYVRPESSNSTIDNSETLSNSSLKNIGIELSDLSGDFSMNFSSENKGEKGEELSSSFQNEVFRRFDLTSYENIKNSEYLSQKIVLYNNLENISGDWQTSRSYIDGKASILLFENYQNIGDENYIYKTVKPLKVEGHDSIIIGIVFKYNKVVVVLSDSGFDENVLINRVLALAKIVEERIKQNNF